MVSLFLDHHYNLFQQSIQILTHEQQGLFGIRFFLRRTLAGCEFGICVDPLYECQNKLLNCLIDTNPIIMLTICTKSSTPWIAGILMIVLVFIVSISVMIGKRINPSTLPAVALKLAKKAWAFFLNKKEEEKSVLDPISFILNPILDTLVKLLQNMRACF